MALRKLCLFTLAATIAAFAAVGTLTVQIKEYEDLVYPNLTVHAFYVKYLLPIWFDVQCMERS